MRKAYENKNITFITDIRFEPMYTLSCRPFHHWQIAEQDTCSPWTSQVSREREEQCQLCQLITPNSAY